MPGPFLVAGNIPYNITSPLIDKALLPPRPRRIVFLVQKEVADRVDSCAQELEYGALSVGVQVVAKAERLFTVPAGAFHPRPKVDSAVLRLTPLAEPLISGLGARELSRDGGRTLRLPAETDAAGVRELTGWERDRVERSCSAARYRGDGAARSAEPRKFVRLHRATR